MVTRKITSFTATSKITAFPGCCYKGVLEVIDGKGTLFRDNAIPYCVMDQFCGALEAEVLHDAVFMEFHGPR
jgi:hypothetical protein